MPSSVEFRPRIAITLGDVAGIGPEVTARALSDPRIWEWCSPVVVGPPEVLQRAGTLIGATFEVVPVASGDPHPSTPSQIACWTAAREEAAAVPPGQLDARAGRAAYDCLVAATRAALAGTIDAIVTAPLSKAALHLAGLNYPGHTEILGELCGVREFGMMLYLPPGTAVKGSHGLGVVHVTLHTSLRSVPDRISPAVVREKIVLISDFLMRMDCPAPRIGVCALNPHAGEGGLFGDEETRLIAPGVQAARNMGIQVSGPWPADTLLKRAAAGEFDGVVAMYHDQGHIALKLIGFDDAVNITLGLPIVRTSPSHGTAFDIAWQGRASGSGMLQALRAAAALATPRMHAASGTHGQPS